LAITVFLLQKFSEFVARYIPNYEIIDYAQEDKLNAPRDTARELAYRLSMVQESKKYASTYELRGLRKVGWKDR
jgi:4-hydroxy-tetrahydrodipicolinate reductase